MVKHVYFDLVTQFRSSCTRRFVSMTRTFPFSFLIASLTALLLSMHTAFWPHSPNGYILICRWQVTINWLNKFLLLLQSMYFSTKWRHRSTHVWIYKGFRVFFGIYNLWSKKAGNVQYPSRSDLLCNLKGFTILFLMGKAIHKRSLTSVFPPFLLGFRSSRGSLKSSCFALCVSRLDK